MTWPFLALTAYFINAISFVIDKHLLAAPIPRPFAYAFGVGILSGVALVLIPFGVTVPAPDEILISIVSGAAFFVALIFFYKSVRRGDISVSATKTGVFTAVFSALFSFLFLGDYLSGSSAVSLVFLIVGAAFLARAGKSILLFSILAGACFGLSFVLLKVLFATLDFINGVFWTRMGLVGASLVTLVASGARREVMSSFRHTPSGSRLLFVFNKALVGSGFLLLYYAIRLGNVALINGLHGFQFVFIFLLALTLGHFIPGVREDTTRHVLGSKILGIAFVLLGFLSLIVL